MQWDDARIFLAVARDGSFSGAAKRLGVQHSTVSRRIWALEEMLAVPLVERKASGYVLTEAGEVLKLSALRIERELLSFEGTVGGQADDAAGELRLTAIANMASTVLMPYFARFSAAYPKIELNIQVTNNSVRLSEREADVAIRQTNTPQDALIGTRLVTVAFAVYGSHNYCAAVKSGKVEEKWIGVDCCDYHRNWTKRAWPQAEHTLYVDETSLTLSALKEGLGVGFLLCFTGPIAPTPENPLTKLSEKSYNEKIGCLTSNRTLHGSYFAFQRQTAQMAPRLSGVP